MDRGCLGVQVGTGLCALPAADERADGLRRDLAENASVRPRESIRCPIEEHESEFAVRRLVLDDLPQHAAHERVGRDTERTVKKRNRNCLAHAEDPHDQIGGPKQRARPWQRLRDELLRVVK